MSTTYSAMLATTRARRASVTSSASEAVDVEAGGDGGMSEAEAVPLSRMSSERRVAVKMCKEGHTDQVGHFRKPIKLTLQESFRYSLACYLSNSPVRLLPVNGIIASHQLRPAVCRS